MGPLSRSQTSSQGCYPAASGQSPISAERIVENCMQKLSDQLSIGHPGTHSTAFSSVSLVPLLGMMLAAMHDSSKKEVILDLPKGSLTPTLEKEIHDLLGKTSRRFASGDHSGVVSTNFLVSAPLQENRALNEEINKYYGAETRVVDFGKIAAETDELVKEKTQGQITSVFGTKDREARDNMELTLGNVLSFQGFWSEPFKEARTQPESFHCANHQTIENVKMMHLTQKVQNAQYGGFSAIAKNFKSDDGQPLRFIAILPSDENPHTIDRLDHATINVLLNHLDESQLKPFQLRIPKIEIDCVDDKLLGKLSDILGVQFTSEELSGLRLTLNSKIDIHNALRVSLGEKGVKGSAVNVVRAQRGMHSPQHPKFFFDRPGYFAIVEGSGNRLVEAVIKDGEYLVTDGPRRVAAREEPLSSRRAEKRDHDRAEIPKTTTGAKKYVSPPDYRQFLNKPFNHDVEEMDHDCVEIPKTATKQTKEDVSSPDYQQLLNKLFNHNGVLNIKGVETDDIFFSIQLGSEDEVITLKEQLLPIIGVQNQNNVTTLSYEFRGQHKHLLSTSFDGTDALIAYLKNTPT